MKLKIQKENLGAVAHTKNTKDEGRCPIQESRSYNKSRLLIQPRRHENDDYRFDIKSSREERLRSNEELVSTFKTRDSTYHLRNNGRPNAFS